MTSDVVIGGGAVRGLAVEFEAFEPHWQEFAAQIWPALAGRPFLEKAVI